MFPADQHFFPNAEGPVIALWPGSCLHAIETLRHPRWEDFDYTSAGPQKNRFSWVGNGWSPVEAAGGDTVRRKFSHFFSPELADPPRLFARRPTTSTRSTTRPFRRNAGMNGCLLSRLLVLFFSVPCFCDPCRFVLWNCSPPGIRTGLIAAQWRLQTAEYVENFRCLGEFASHFQLWSGPALCSERIGSCAR